jgi:hypothetical protein
MPGNEGKRCVNCGGSVDFRYIRGRSVPLHQGTNGCHVSLKKNLHKNAGARGIRLRDLLYKKRLIPFIHKGWCEEEVWFYEDEMGSKVWFDSPNPPWPKHECRPASDHSSKSLSGKGPKEKSWIPVVLYYERFQYQKNIRQVQIRSSETEVSFGVFDVLELDDWRRVILRENWKAAWLAEESDLMASGKPMVIYCPKKREFNDEERIDYMKIKVSKDPQGRFPFL